MENLGFPPRYFHPGHEALLNELLAVTREVGCTPAQVAVQWLLEQPQVASAIVGARTADQLSDTFAAAGWQLPAEARQPLDTVLALSHHYPCAMEETMAEPGGPDARLLRLKLPVKPRRWTKLPPGSGRSLCS